MAVQYNSKDNSWSGIVVDLLTAKKEIAEVSDEATKFFDKYQKNGKNLSNIVSNSLSTKGGFENFIKQSKLADESLISFLQDTEYSEKTLANYQLYLKNTAKTTTLFQRATKAAGTAIRTLGAAAANMAIAFAGAWLFSKAIDVVDKIIHRTERISEAAEKAKSNIRELNNSFNEKKQNVSDISKRYAELAQGVNQINGANLTLNDDDYKEFLDLSNQLADIFPTLVKGYDENGSAILDLSGNVNTIILSLNDLIKVEKELTNQKILEDMPTVYKGFSQEIENLNDVLSENKALQASWKFNLDDFTQGYENYEDGYYLKFQVDPRAKSDVIAEINNILSNAGELVYGWDGFQELGEAAENEVIFRLSEEAYNKIANNNELTNAIAEASVKYNSNLQKTINNTQKKLESEYSNFNSTLINNILSTDYSYASLSNNTQFVIQQIIKDIDWSEAKESFEENGWDGANAYVNSIIQGITDASPDVRNAISKLFNNSLHNVRRIFVS